MPHELHLVESLVNGHRPGLVQLLTHDHRGVAELRLNGDTRLGGGRGGVLDRRVTGVGDKGLLHTGSCLEVLIRCGHGVTAVVVLLAVPGPAKALGQLAHGDIKSGEAVRGGGLRPDDRALGDDSDLHSLGGVGLARVALVGDLHLDTLDPGVELLNLDGLVLDVVAQARADLGVTTDDGDIHGGTSFWARGPALTGRVRQVPATSHGGFGTGVITSWSPREGPQAPRRGSGRLSLSA